MTAYDVFSGDPSDERSSAGSTSTCTRARASTSTPRSSRSPTGSPAGSCAEGVLVCNFSRGLMEHDHVVTLFHEFGHLVHHVLAGRGEWIRFSGVATEWDFVEAPSQMLEEWAWDADILRSFATDADGEPIPADLVERMRAADDFGKGYLARTQMFYAAMSYWFHTDRPADLTAAMRELQARYSPFPYIDGTHMFASFGHLGGYSSAYYTYMWSLVIAKDLFSAFDPDDLFDAEVAGRYRDRVLAPGGSQGRRRPGRRLPRPARTPSTRTPPGSLADLIRALQVSAVNRRTPALDGRCSGWRTDGFRGRPANPPCPGDPSTYAHDISRRSATVTGRSPPRYPNSQTEGSPVMGHQGIQPTVGPPRRGSSGTSTAARRAAARGAAGDRAASAGRATRDRRRGWPASSAWPRATAAARAAGPPRRRPVRDPRRGAHRAGERRGGQRLPGHPADRRAQQRRLAPEPGLGLPDRPAARGRGPGRDRRHPRPTHPAAHRGGRGVRRRARRRAGGGLDAVRGDRTRDGRPATSPTSSPRSAR